MRLSLIHLNTFRGDWAHLKLNDDDLRALEWMLVEHPDIGDPMPGTGGLRKVRFAPPSSRRGKRGALRVIYALIPDLSIAILFAAYGKGEKANLNESEKKIYRDTLRRFAEWLRAHESGQT